MNILITGAAGGIGAPLAKSLANENLLLIDNLSSGNLKNLERLGLKNQILEIDLLDNNSVLEKFQEFKPEIVIHLAATTSLPECEANPSYAYSNNVLSTVNVLNASKSIGVRRLLFASTSAVYENNVDFPFSELDSVQPNLTYPVTKHIGEQICRSFSVNYGLPITVLRLFNVVGPYQNFFRKSPPLVNYLVIEYLCGRTPLLHSNGQQKRDYISVFDVCSAISVLLSIDEGQDLFQIYNICSGSQFSVREIDEIVREELGISITPNFRPATKFWISYPELFSGKLTFNEKLIESEVNKNSLGDPSIMNKKNNWRATDFEVQLRKMIRIIADDYNSIGLLDQKLL